HKSERIDDTLGRFFASLAYWGLMIVVLIAVLSRFGVETTSLVATLGAATLAIGLALQGTLSNLAAGVMIVLFRPYGLGDWVEVAGQAGTVTDINLFTTELATGDNKKVIVPNGQSWGSVITNYSANKTRRVDMGFSIDYGDDIELAMGVIQTVLEADKRVLKDPAVFTAVRAHGASSIDIVCRAWCLTGDYWGVYFDAMKTVKQAFDANGISIPYPHQVNVVRQS
ncbi:MAG: small conductance mechanosensitive channel, partial [Maricaulis sp.]